jgi:hypothetical protein
MRWIEQPPVRRPSLRRSALVGITAGSAYLAEQALDMRLAPNHHDDLLLWGGFLSRQPVRARLLGLMVHYTLSVALATAYAAVSPALPGRSGWVRGLLFVQAENALLYPGVPFLDALHPGIRAGRLPTLRTWRYWWVELARHAAFGAVLGALSEE